MAARCIQFSKNMACLFALVFFSAPLLAEPYTPPSTPELYDVDEPLVPAWKFKKVKSHVYLGLGGGFGTSSRTGAKDSAKTSWNAVVEGGYIRAISSWSRVGLGLDMFTGQVGSSDHSINLSVGSLAHISYGYNISERLHGILRAGFGLAMGEYEGPTTKDKFVAGNIWQLGLQVMLPTESQIDILGGIFFNQYNFSEKGMYHTLEARLGLRYRL